MSIGPEKILVVFLVALIVLGPKRLPEAARQMGKAVGEFKRISADFEAEVRDVLHTTDGSVDLTDDQQHQSPSQPPSSEI